MVWMKRASALPFISPMQVAKASPWNTGKTVKVRIPVQYARWPVERLFDWFKGGFEVTLCNEIMRFICIRESLGRIRSGLFRYSKDIREMWRFLKPQITMIFNKLQIGQIIQINFWMRKRMNCYGLADAKQIIKIRAIRGSKTDLSYFCSPEL